MDGESSIAALRPEFVMTSWLSHAQIRAYLLATCLMIMMNVYDARLLSSAAATGTPSLVRKNQQAPAAAALESGQHAARYHSPLVRSPDIGPYCKVTRGQTFWATNMTWQFDDMSSASLFTEFRTSATDFKTITITATGSDLPSKMPRSTIPSSARVVFQIPALAYTLPATDGTYLCTGGLHMTITIPNIYQQVQQMDPDSNYFDLQMLQGMQLNLQQLFLYAPDNSSQAAWLADLPAKLPSCDNDAFIFPPNPEGCAASQVMANRSDKPPDESNGVIKLGPRPSRLAAASSRSRHMLVKAEHQEPEPMALVKYALYMEGRMEGGSARLNPTGIQVTVSLNWHEQDGSYHLQATLLKSWNRDGLLGSRLATYSWSLTIRAIHEDGTPGPKIALPDSHHAPATWTLDSNTMATLRVPKGFQHPQLEIMGLVGNPRTRGHRPQLPRLVGVKSSGCGGRSGSCSSCVIRPELPFSLHASV